MFSFLKSVERNKVQLAKICGILNFILWTFLLVLYCTVFISAVQNSESTEEKRDGPPALLGDVMHLEALTNQSQSQVQKNNRINTSALLLQNEIQYDSVTTAVILTYFAVIIIFSVCVAIIFLIGLQHENLWKCKLWLYSSYIIFVTDSVMILVALILEGYDSFLLLKLICHMFYGFSIWIIRAYVEAVRVRQAGPDPKAINKMPHPIPIIVVCDYDKCEVDPSPVIATFPKSSLSNPAESSEEEIPQVEAGVNNAEYLEMQI